MRWLVVMLLVARAAADAPTGFDHTVHARDLEVSGQAAIACTRCHDQKAGRLVGRPGHDACFGTCHGPAPRRGDKLDRIKLCANCHAESTLATKPTVSYPPYRVDRDFSVLLGHKQHATAPCTQCHDPISKKVPAPHARCVACHDGQAKAFAMTDCASCHPRAVGRPQPPELRTVQNTVTSIYSHATHAARGGAGRDCATCHAKVKDATETEIELPRPTANDCALCHDGKAAFSVTVACTRCHAAPKDKFDVDRPDARFRHDGSHASLVSNEPCSTCHVLDAKSGDTQLAGHAACTSCHADDFGARHPTKCGACHNATEPWRHLRADRALPAATEFGALIDHGVHPAACSTCHSLSTPTSQLRMPHEHAACSACHTATTGPAPHLTDCNACHQLGLQAARIANTMTAAWSVRRAFDHGKHREDEQHAPLACIACHTSVTGKLGVIATPAKATCAPCHDGTRTFKLTGTTCRKCHT